MARDRPPSIGGSFLAGAARDLKRDQLATFAKALRDHGGRRVRARVGPPRVGFEFDLVFRPEHARQVLATEAASYDKEVPGMDELRRLIGNGLFLSDGDRWRRDRRIVAPLFTRKRVASHVEGMVAAADRVVAEWSAAPGGRVDLTRDAMGYVLDVLGRSVFGSDVEQTAPVLRATVPVINDHAARRLLSPVHFPWWVPTAANRRVERARRELFGLVDRLVAERRAGTLDGDDLLSLLLTARDPEDGTALDDASVRDQALIFLLAGHETTGTALALALQVLGRHPNVQDRVRSEVATVGAADVARLTYTGHVVHEVLRLYSPAHTLPRHAHRATTLDGHEVRPGHLVAVSVWGVHHNPDVWPDPDRFDPDRFAVEVPRYHHLPFGGGPRACIGQHLGLAELVVGVATLVHAFRLESELENPPLEAAVSVRPAGPLPCRVTRL